MASRISIRQIHPVFVGEVTGIDLRQHLVPDDVAAIEAGMDRYAVLVFRNQPLDDDQQLAFSKNFGAIEPQAGGNIIKGRELRLKDGMIDVSNLDQDGKPLERTDRRRMFNLGNRLWHSDSSFRPIPAKYSILSGRVVADEGGDTEFADMRVAYDMLDDRTRNLVEDMVCEHSLLYSRGKLGFNELTEDERAMMKPVRHVMVRVHPVTGRKSLYLSSHAGNIIGWPLPEATDFLRELAEQATKPDRIYAHKWRVGDVVMWDNRQTMHRVRPFDDTKPRDMRRTTIVGDGPTMQQAAA